MRALANTEHRSPLAVARAKMASVPVVLFGFFATFYALTSAGRLDSADGVVIAQAARSLLRGRLSIPGYVTESVIGVNGLAQSRYGIGESFIETPFVLIGSVLSYISHNAALINWTIAFTNGFVTAAGCALFYLLLRELGASQRRGIVLTLILGLCTVAWPYAKSDFTEPLQATCLIGATLGAVYWHKRGGLRWLVLAGAFLGGLLLTKAAGFVAVPAFSLFVIVALLTVENRLTLRPLRRREWWIRCLTAQCALLSLVVVATAITIAINLARFGLPFDFGYGRDPHDALFSIPVYTGIFGMLFSFNSGIIFYATPVVLGVLGYKRFVQRHLPESVLIAVVSVTFLVLYGGYYYWAGLAAFGPRYIVPIVPLLLLPAIEADFGLRGGRVVNRGLVALVAVIVVLGFLEQLSGVLVSFTTYSAIVCVQVPCVPSLDPTQSELLYNLWLLPAALADNFLGHATHIVLASYPFGTPPLGRANWAGMLADRIHYFWFRSIPIPPIASALAALLLIGIIVMFALRLRRFILEPALSDAEPRISLNQSAGSYHLPLAGGHPRAREDAAEQHVPPV